MLAIVVLLAASAVTAGVGTVAAGSTTEVTADASEENPIKFVYVDGSTGNLTFVRADGTRVGTNVSGPSDIGSMADLDSDGLLEATYVTGNQAVKAVDVNNETQQLGTNARTSSTKIGVGDWTGDGVPEVLYVNSDGGNIHYSNVSGEPTQVTDASVGAVLGVADFDGSGEQEIVYTYSSSIKYYNESGGTTHTRATRASDRLISRAHPLTSTGTTRTGSPR